MLCYVPTSCELARFPAVCNFHLKYHIKHCRLLYTVGSLFNFYINNVQLSHFKFLLHQPLDKSSGKSPLAMSTQSVHEPRTSRDVTHSASRGSRVFNFSSMKSSGIFSASSGNHYVLTNIPVLYTTETSSYQSVPECCNVSSHVCSSDEVNHWVARRV